MSGHGENQRAQPFEELLWMLCLGLCVFLEGACLHLHTPTRFLLICQLCPTPADKSASLILCSASAGSDSGPCCRQHKHTQTLLLLQQEGQCLHNANQLKLLVFKLWLLLCIERPGRRWVGSKYSKWNKSCSGFCKKRWWWGWEVAEHLSEPPRCCGLCPL